MREHEPNINLILGDCMDLMRSKPDKYYDLAIVDPPYGINVNHNMGRRAGNKSSNYKPVQWDFEPPKQEYFKELQRVSEHQIIWGANHFMDLISARSPCWIVWDKLFSVDVSFASCELAFTSFNSVTKRFAFSSARTSGIHPTQKPVPLLRKLIEIFTDPGDVVIDPVAGSGTTLLAADECGRKAYGFEIKKNFFKEATELREQYRLRREEINKIGFARSEISKGSKTLFDVMEDAV